MSEGTSVIDNRSCLLMTLQHSTLCANSFFSEARFPRDISAPYFERSITLSRNAFKHISNLEEEIRKCWGRGLGVGAKKK